MKDFSDTKDELLYLVKQNGSLSVNDAVTYTGLAKATLREHFLQLERDGYVKREYVRSGRGRPGLHYQMTAEGNRLFPSAESDLLRELLRFLKEKGDEEAIELFFTTFWEKRLTNARQRMDNASNQDPKARMQALMGYLEEEGFMPEFEQNPTDENLIVRECNCPFREVVKETTLPCKLEAVFYQKLFEKPVERTSYIADGDYACTYQMTVPEEG